MSIPSNPNTAWTSADPAPASGRAVAARAFVPPEVAQNLLLTERNVSLSVVSRSLPTSMRTMLQRTS